MNKLKSQMAGPNNLTNIFDLPSPANNSNGSVIDHGFNSEQMRIVDETNQVRLYIYILFIYIYIYAKPGVHIVGG